MRLGFLLLVATASCQLVLPIQETSDDAALDATEDVAIDDASSDAGDASDGPVNLLLNPSFEQGLADAGCGSFWTYSPGVTLHQPSSIAHSGGRSCEICATQPQNGVSQSIPVSFPANTSFAFGAWIAPVPPDPSATGRAFFGIHYKGPDGGPMSAYTNDVKTSYDGGWVQLFQSGSAPQPTDQLTLSLQFTGNADGGCILIDDAFVIPQ